MTEVKIVTEQAIGAFVKNLEAAIVEGFSVDYSKPIEARKLATGVYKTTLVKAAPLEVETDLKLKATDALSVWAAQKIEEAENIQDVLDFAKSVGVEYKPAKSSSALGNVKRGLKQKLGLV
jgi:molybdopterin-guanine dinucleotide biosynthesis protein